MWTIPAALGLAIALWAQTPASFDAASIRPNHSNSGHQSVHSTAGRLVIENLSLRKIIERAYDMPDNRLIAPGWMASDDFDITASAGGPAKDAQLNAMLQPLLAARFHLAVHREDRTLPVFALTVAKGRPRLPAAAFDGAYSLNGRGVDYELEGTLTMSEFVRALTPSLDRPVVDRSGLGGIYVFKLDWSNTLSSGSINGKYPDIFAAIQEQLGLKLVATEAPVPVLVVDHSDAQPTPN
ncbi:MAG: TIGR03435 family protein [Terriglobales bacterium]